MIYYLYGVFSVDKLVADWFVFFDFDNFDLDRGY